MVNLDMMLVNDADSVLRDVQQATHLFERAVEEGGDTAAMVCIGFLLGGTNAVGENTAFVRDMFEEALEQSGQRYATNSFENLLAGGTEDQPHGERGRKLILNDREVLGM